MLRLEELLQSKADELAEAAPVRFRCALQRLLQRVRESNLSDTSFRSFTHSNVRHSSRAERWCLA
jgi:hypothetical protein